MPWTSSVVNDGERKVANIHKASITEGCQSRGDANARCGAHGLLQCRYWITCVGVGAGVEGRDCPLGRLLGSDSLPDSESCCLGGSLFILWLRGLTHTGSCGMRSDF